MKTDIDLDSYFERIGYADERAAIPEALRAITLAHTQSIPFENLNPWLRWPVPLDAESLQRKLVRERRGGYCFEQNLLLGHVLSALGFGITGLAARILWSAADGAVTPRGHMLLLVTTDGEDTPYVVDVGFGVLTPTAPLRLIAGLEQTTPHEPFRLITARGQFTLQAQVSGAWKSLYQFDLQQQFLPDYEITNWYLSNHPASRFVTHLIATRPDRHVRYTLQDTEFAARFLDGRVERHPLRTGDELREALEGTFRVRLPQAPAVDAALSRLAAQAT